MPQIPIPPGVVLVTASGEGGSGDIWNNVFALINAGPISEAGAAVFNGRFATLYNDLKTDGVFPLGWKHTATKINVQAGGARSVYEFPATTSAVGGNKLPPQLAICVSMKTPFSGPRFRGRCFLGPLNVGAIEPDGKVLNAFRTGIVTRFNTLRTGLQTDGAPLAVWSRVGAHATAVSGFSVGPYVDTQRRRRSTLRG